MSRHRIVHTFDADDIVSEFDGYAYDEEGEDELSPEDKAAMANGTAEVQRALGVESAKVTIQQIQEALWHYYYDVDKSVTYLTKTFIAPAPKPTPKKAPEGTSRLVFCHATHSRFEEGSGAGHEPSAWKDNFGEFTTRIPPSFFDDMPWFNIPKQRQTVFIEPSRPRGGLLGGGDGPPKLSKLQALAAARKKKTEERKLQEKMGQAEKGIHKLAIDEESRDEKQKTIQASKRQKISETTSVDPHGRSSHLQTSDEISLRRKEEHDAHSLHVQPDVMVEPSISNTKSQIHIPPPKAPSAFAQVLCGPAPKDRKPYFDPEERLPFPYTRSPFFNPSAFEEPSPDDIVLAAQAQAGKKNPPVSKALKKVSKEKDISAEDQVTKDVSSLKVDDAPPPKSKGLDVVREFENSANKRSISFVVVGHVDAGKSTLMGRLLLELKFIEKHTIERYRSLAEKSGKQSFALAWVMDQRSDEREHGVTIDIATNNFTTAKTNFTILDAPGHRDFIPNMIAGASQADFAILVIDANTGAYERGLKGQTKEHVLLLRSLGVQRLVIAVNKLDMVGWSQERFDEIQQQVSGFLTGLGFSNKNVTFVPISGLNGDNLVQRTEDPAASWYTGTTLIEALEDSGPTSARALKKPFRMAISEVFRSQQGTTTISGRVDAGTIQIGDAILVQPSGEEAYIKSIMVDSDMQDWAVAGQRASIALSNIDPIHIRVGDMLCHTVDPITCGDTFTMKAMAFEHLMPMPVDLHRGRLHSAGGIQSILATLDKATGSVINKKPKIVQPGSVARVVIKLESKAPLESGQRVVIRSGGETIAAGLLE